MYCNWVWFIDWQWKYDLLIGRWMRWLPGPLHLRASSWAAYRRRTGSSSPRGHSFRHRSARTFYFITILIRNNWVTFKLCLIKLLRPSFARRKHLPLFRRFEHKSQRFSPLFFCVLSQLSCAMSNCENPSSNQCCGYGMFIPDPDFYLFRIPDPNTATKDRGEICCQTFFCSHKFHKIENYFIF